MPEPSAPERIWLQRIEVDYRDWTWCWHDVGECEDPDVEYVRVDVAYELAARALEERARDEEYPGQSTMLTHAADFLRSLHNEAPGVPRGHEEER